jgi:hypothetical protein
MEWEYCYLGYVRCHPSLDRIRCVHASTCWMNRLLWYSMLRGEQPDSFCVLRRFGPHIFNIVKNLRKEYMHTYKAHPSFVTKLPWIWFDLIWWMDGWMDSPIIWYDLISAKISSKFSFPAMNSLDAMFLFLTTYLCCVCAPNGMCALVFVFDFTSLRFLIAFFALSHDIFWKEHQCGRDHYHISSERISKQ